MGKECSQLFSVPIISDVEEMEELWVDASPAGPWGEHEEDKEGHLTGVDEMRREEWEQGHRVLRSSRNQKVGRGAGSFIKARERGLVHGPVGAAGDGRGWGCWLWPREGQMGNDMMRLPFLGLGACCPYQVSLAHNILHVGTESSRGGGWCRKLMEDVTNHKIYDKSILSSDHANNLECVFYNNTVSAERQSSAKNHLKHPVIQL